MRIFVTDMDWSFENTDEQRRLHFSRVLPRQLDRRGHQSLRPEAHIEIEAMAIVRGSRAGVATDQRSAGGGSACGHRSRRDRGQAHDRTRHL